MITWHKHNHPENDGRVVWSTNDKNPFAKRSFHITSDKQNNKYIVGVVDLNRLPFEAAQKLAQHLSLTSQEVEKTFSTYDKYFNTLEEAKAFAEKEYDAPKPVWGLLGKI